MRILVLVKTWERSALWGINDAEADMQISSARGVPKIRHTSARNAYVNTALGCKVSCYNCRTVDLKRGTVDTHEGDFILSKTIGKCYALLGVQIVAAPFEAGMFLFYYGEDDVSIGTRCHLIADAFELYPSSCAVAGLDRQRTLKRFAHDASVLSSDTSDNLDTALRTVKELFK